MESTVNMEVNFIDQFLSRNEQEIVLNYCLSASYHYGEQDNPDTPVTGMIHNIPETEFVYKLFRKTIADKVDEVRQMKLYRMYINCFVPAENPYYHIDGEGLTFLYYPNVDWDLQQGGETQFYIDESIYGIVPKPNRMVVFDGMILHRATSFRNQHRFTVAIKYSPQ